MYEDRLDWNYNWIWENITCDTCSDCKMNPYFGSNILVCLENIEDCPFCKELKELKRKSEELLKQTEELSKRIHREKEPYTVNF